MAHAEKLLTEIQKEERRLAVAEGREFEPTGREISGFHAVLRISHAIEAAELSSPVCHSPRSLLSGIVDVDFLET